MKPTIKSASVYSTIFLIATAMGYGASDVLLSTPQRPALARATWVERHASLPSLARSADAIITGKVADIRLGRVVTGADPDSDPLQFSDVVLRTAEIVKGDVRPGDDVTVEIVGDYVSADGARPGRIEGMPNFHKGERFLLFLKRQKQEPYEWYVLNNQAAFELVRGGRATVLQAVDHHDPVASELDDLTLDVALQRIRGALAEGQ